MSVNSSKKILKLQISAGLEILATTRYSFNPFVPNAPFLYPLKISKNFTIFFIGALGTNGLRSLFVSILISCPLDSNYWSFLQILSSYLYPFYSLVHTIYQQAIISDQQISNHLWMEDS